MATTIDRAANHYFRLCSWPLELFQPLQGRPRQFEVGDRARILYGVSDALEPNCYATLFGSEPELFSVEMRAELGGEASVGIGPRRFPQTDHSHRSRLTWIGLFTMTGPCTIREAMTGQWIVCK